jgi:hypothetical protein
MRFSAIRPIYHPVRDHPVRPKRRPPLLKPGGERRLTPLLQKEGSFSRNQFTIQPPRLRRSLNTEFVFQYRLQILEMFFHGRGLALGGQDFHG